MCNCVLCLIFFFFFFLGAGVSVFACTCWNLSANWCVSVTRSVSLFVMPARIKKYWLICFNNTWGLWLGFFSLFKWRFQRIPLDFIIICVSFAGWCWGLNRKIMRRSNGGVYSRPVCQNRSALRNNKMEVKRHRGRRGGTQAGASLLKEWRIDRPWQRPINPDGQVEPVRRFSRVAGVTQTTGRWERN